MCENHIQVVIGRFASKEIEKKIAKCGKKSIFCTKKTGIYESIG